MKVRPQNARVVWWLGRLAAAEVSAICTFETGGAGRESQGRARGRAPGSWRRRGQSRLGCEQGAVCDWGVVVVVGWCGIGAVSCARVRLAVEQTDSVQTFCPSAFGTTRANVGGLEGRMRVSVEAFHLGVIRLACLVGIVAMIRPSCVYIHLYYSDTCTQLAT